MGKMNDLEFGRMVRELLMRPEVERIEIYGKVGKELVRAVRQIELVRVPKQKPEQIRPDRNLASVTTCA